jgi:hypothetical protein
MPDLPYRFESGVHQHHFQIIRRSLDRIVNSTAANGSTVTESRDTVYLFANKVRCIQSVDGTRQYMAKDRAENMEIMEPHPLPYDVRLSASTETILADSQVSPALRNLSNAESVRQRTRFTYRLAQHPYMQFDLTHVQPSNAGPTWEVEVELVDTELLRKLPRNDMILVAQALISHAKSLNRAVPMGIEEERMQAVMQQTGGRRLAPGVELPHPKFVRFVAPVGAPDAKKPRR